jgi:hypothetical protein
MTIYSENLDPTSPESAELRENRPFPVHHE